LPDRPLLESQLPFENQRPVLEHGHMQRSPAMQRAATEHGAATLRLPAFLRDIPATSNSLTTDHSQLHRIHSYTAVTATPLFCTSRRAPRRRRCPNGTALQKLSPIAAQSPPMQAAPRAATIEHWFTEPAQQTAGPRSGDPGHQGPQSTGLCRKAPPDSLQGTNP